MIETNKLESLNSIATQLTRIANVLEIIYKPQIEEFKKTSKLQKEKETWEEQARFYQQATIQKNEDKRKLEKENKELKEQLTTSPFATKVSKK